MQVVCVQCHSVVIVEDAGSSAPRVAARCQLCGAAIDVQELAADAGETAWLIQADGGLGGPFSAAHVALMFDRGGADWSSLVWRAGFRDWRPARRDPELVTALASARGASWDTQRVAEQTSLLPDSEAPELASAPPANQPPTECASSAPPNQPPSEPILLPPAALRSPARWEQPGSTDAPTFADVLRSAPSMMMTLPVLEPAHARPLEQRASGLYSWFPSARSMMVVAVLAFASGVLVAVYWGRLLESAQVRASTLVLSAPPQRPAASAQSQPASAPPPSAPRAADALADTPGAPRAADALADTPQPAASQAADVPPEALRERPDPSELAREFKRIAPDVRRCAEAPVRGVDVELFFDGASGQVAGVNLHASRLTAGAVECITQALRQLHVTPFQHTEHKLWHRFAL